MSFIGVLMSCVVVILLLFIILCIIMFIVSKKENREQPQNFFTNEGGSKHALVVYHDSPSHTVRRGVDVINKKLVRMKYTVDNYVARNDLSLDLSKYPVIVLASPTYMGRVAAPILNFVIRHQFEKKRVLIFVNGQFINNRGEITELSRFIEKTNVVLYEKCSGIFDELEKTVEKIEDKSLKAKGTLEWEKIKDEEKRTQSSNGNKK